MIDFFLADIEQIILPKINNFNLTVLSITFFFFLLQRKIEMEKEIKNR